MKTTLTIQACRKFTVCLIVAAATAIVLLFQGSTLAAEVPPAAKKLIPTAEKEGTLAFGWLASVFDGARSIKAFEKGFNAYYGTRIKFKFTPGRNFPANARRQVQELAAGKTSKRDVVIGGGGQVRYLIGKKVNQRVDWGSLVPHIPEKALNEIVAPDKSLVTVISHIPGILYNTRMISKADAPRRLTDLLNPKWKGKISSTPFAAVFGVLPYHSAWTKDKVLDFARKLSGNLGGLMGCGAYDRVTSGEFWLFAINCSDGRTERLQAKGAPVERVIPEDMVLVRHWYMGVPKNAAHGAAGKLFIAWLLTPEGQKQAYTQQYDDLHYLKGSRTAKRIEAAAKKFGQQIVDVSLGRALNLEHPKLQRQVGKIFRESRKGKGKKGKRGKR